MPDIYIYIYPIFWSFQLLNFIAIQNIKKVLVANKIYKQINNIHCMITCIDYTNYSTTQNMCFSFIGTH